MRPIFTLLLRVALLLVFVAACGKNEGKSAATQVAAKVNSDEITIHEINAVLAKNPDLTAEAAARAKQQILDRLIDRQLAVQQALRRKLDRSPEVAQAVAAARAEILARAFAEEIARSQPKPNAVETIKYYAEHPELFAQRRLFALEEISIASSEGAPAGLTELVSKARSMQEVAAWLKSKDARFVENRGVRAAEQIPLDTLLRLHAMKEGEMRLIESGGGKFQVIRLVAAKAAPIDEATARPRIEQFLLNQRAKEALAREMKQVKQAAKIEYRGEFAANSGETVPDTARK